MNQPPRMPSEAELHDILNYTIVALVGLLGGFIIGCLFGHGPNPASTPPPDRTGAAVEQLNGPPPPVLPRPSHHTTLSS
ncbi:MAG: hypothetical protein H7A44_05165 [Opitutaceae bacterium]|nr:hypothetical protein [Cephaloticoccus sp.]MCP5529812.1 hypothetical protein [Opitutaceae bacterium]